MFAIRHRQSLRWVTAREPIFAYHPDWDKAERFPTREAAESAMPEEMRHAHQIGLLPTKSRIHEKARRL